LAIEILHVALHLEFTVTVLDGSDAAQALVVAPLVHAYFDFRLARNIHTDNTVGVAPIRHTVVDQCEDSDALEFVEVLSVDPDCLTGGNSASAIVS
jgi:hypothetical protein